MKQKLFFALGIICLLLALVFQLLRFLRPVKAGIKIDTNPPAVIYLNNKQVGKTPWESRSLKPGTITVKLVPEGQEIVWERQFNLEPNTLLVIHRNFASTQEETEGEVFYLQKSGLKDKAGLIVTSFPDGASVTVDGQMRGFTPLNLEDIGEGQHRIGISAPGHKSKEIVAKAIAGYQLVVEVKLGQDLSLSQPQEATPSGEEKQSSPQVVIKETPTGWLRVRMGPSLSATEAAKVYPGEKYPLLEEQEGWYKIRYQENKEGWISARYAEKLE